MTGRQSFQLALFVFFVGLGVGWEAWWLAASAACLAAAVLLGVRYDRRATARAARSRRRAQLPGEET